MGYLLAVIRTIALALIYSIFGLIGLGLFLIFYSSQQVHYRGIVYFTRLWAQCSCSLLNIRINRIGRLKVYPGSLIVANHVGTPDIFVMGSCFPAFFVSKAEISRWPFMNWLARLGATIFVDRNQRQHRLEHRPRAARHQVQRRHRIRRDRDRAVGSARRGDGRWEILVD